jgi:homoserine O-succinyltransferase
VSGASRVERRGAVVVGLVNNMPDAALEATERQFEGLLASAAAPASVVVRRYFLPMVPRGADARRRVDEAYLPADALADDAPDALIVTGTEPQAADLRAEPYWGSLADLIDWAAASVPSTVFSCLGAHAAVLRLDGIARVPLECKRCGVYEQAVVQGDALTAGVPPRVAAVHSRLNDLAAEELRACGYTPLVASASVGVHMFAKRAERLLIFFQGHPEYETESLLKEYRRDVKRFLRGERDGYPPLPEGYFGADAVAALEDFRARAVANPREETLAAFPYARAAASLANTWAASARLLFRNWLQAVAADRD